MITCTIHTTPIRNHRNYLRAVSKVKEGSEKWWREAMNGFCFLRNNQDQFADRESPCERRFGTPQKCCKKTPIGADVCESNLCDGEKSSSSILAHRCFLNSCEGWTGDLITADWHDIENYVASEVHGKRFKFKEVFWTATSVSFFPLSVIHIACMTTSTRRASPRKKVQRSRTHQFFKWYLHLLAQTLP